MNILDEYIDKLLSIVNSDWIQVNDATSPWTIESFNYCEGIYDTDPHCTKCVAVNKCWFKNKKGTKPDGFNWANYLPVKLLLPSLGLYHPSCHCNETSIKAPTKNDIRLIIPEGKIDWLIKDKLNWINAMGYQNSDSFVEVIKELIKESYCSGNYEIVSHNQYGIKINLFLSIPGKNEKLGKIYNCKSNFMIFPNGKLKCNTLLGGWN